MYPTSFSVGTSGRSQSLVGVGVYYRTYFKIKVYGVALYVDEDGVRGDAGMRGFKEEGREELGENEM